MSEAPDFPTSPPRFDRVAWLVLWGGLLAYSLAAAPTPYVNEPHYLCKARHFWDPSWCRGDLFLESFNAHAVFYELMGWWTTWLPFAVVAWLGRVVALGWLAAGFVSALQPVAGSRTRIWLIVAGWLALQACGSFSGEWVVGGIEGKVFAYAGLLCGWGALCRSRLVMAGLWTGIAMAFHPVVGGWGLLAALGAILLSRLTGSRLLPQSGGVSWLRILTAAGLLVIAALPGLVPALRMLSQPVEANVRFAGTYLQVYHRLGHHLDPMLFPWTGYACYGLLLGLLLILGWRQRSQPLLRAFCLVTLCAVVFALAGVAIGYGPRPPQQMPWYESRMHLLKFYPFRLADALLPLAVCVLVVEHVKASPRLLGSLAGLLLVAALARGGSLAGEYRLTKEQNPDWIAGCRWLRDHAPADSLVMTPHDSWSFKWYAGLPEYVNFKDCPQDAAGIVEWNRRLLFQQKWFQQHYADQLYSTTELRDLRRETGAAYLITDHLGPMEPTPVFEQGAMRVYDLRAPADAQSPASPR